MNKKAISVLVILFLILILLWQVSTRPVLLCPTAIPDAYRDAVISQSSGIYSRSLPLVPVCVVADSYENNTVTYTIFYFPFGSVGMSYSETDGYNIEKALTALQ